MIGGDFEGSKWKLQIPDGMQVLPDPDDPDNHALKVPLGLVGDRRILHKIDVRRDAKGVDFCFRIKVEPGFPDEQLQWATRIFQDNWSSGGEEDPIDLSEQWTEHKLRREGSYRGVNFEFRILNEKGTVWIDDLTLTPVYE